MKRVYYILNKCLHYLLALQVLNLSFSNLAMEGHVFSGQGIENNQIDSAIEFITEQVLGWNDFVPEQHKAHQDRHFLKVNTCSLFCERTALPASTISTSDDYAHPVFVAGSLTEIQQEINPPPPKSFIAG